MRAVVAGLLVAALAGLGACTSPGRPSAPTFSVPPVSTAPRSATAAPGAGTANWPTYHGDLARTGYSPTMPVASGPLRVTHRVTLDGAVYASPIVVGGRTYVATENDSLYALDAAGTVRWRTHLGEPSPGTERDCGNIDPLGITGTPVYDAATNSVFVVAEYGAPPRHELVAVDASTGAVLRRTSVDLPGADAKAMQERGALTVTAGRVWIPFGGLDGDCGNYKGRVIGVPTRGGTAVSFTVPTSRKGGIWTPPGPVVDARGRLLVSIGNGEAGKGDSYDHSDAVLALDPIAHLVDSFSPASWAADNDADKDLGSQGPTLVGGWVFIAGKSGTGYVLRADRLGGIGGQVSSTDLCRSFGGTAVANDFVYVPCTDGVRAISIAGSGAIVKHWRADSAITGSPLVGGGRVWSLNPKAGVLHALDPSTGRSVAHVTVGETSRFATPAMSGRVLIVPTLTGVTFVATSAG
jgi:outer membrane protein assembly factor BamB